MYIHTHNIHIHMHVHMHVHVHNHMHVHMRVHLMRTYHTSSLRMFYTRVVHNVTY